MLSSIGQCVALVTHAQAALEGRGEEFDWKANPWFGRTAEYRFGVGEAGGASAGEDPNHWFETLRAQGFQGAALFAEPFDGSWDVIMRVGFAGGLRLGPVTTLHDGTEVVWHERPRFDQTEQAWRVYRGGFRVLPGQERVRASIPIAALRLDVALSRMVEYQRKHRPGEAWFSETFVKGRALLRTGGLLPSEGGVGEPPSEILDRVRPLFPTPFDPAALSLVAAVEAAWALGGMGWWNDWDTAAEGFAEVTFPYYEALLAALVASCEPSARSASA